MSDARLFEVEPRTLTAARQVAHAACQWPSRAARTNLTAEADDSHSNLGWETALNALAGHPLDDAGHRLAYRFEDGHLLWLQGEKILDSWQYDGDEPALYQWIDGALAGAGLTGAAGAVMPYSLPPSPSAAEADAAARANLGRWFARTNDILLSLASRFSDRSVNPAAVRCWPHHFDMAVLFTLDRGDPETARSVGVGLSPGDDSYEEPYFYCTPWPAPDAGALPDAPEPFRWHTLGFVSMVATAEAWRDQEQGLTARVTEAAEAAFAMLE
jgi:hypothetical protein